MRKIFKYELPVDGHVITIKEKVIKWLDVRIQNGWPHVWAIVDVDIIEPTEIIAWGTGWEVPQEIMECGYLGTEIDDYGYVWHYFWKKVETATETTKTYIDNNIEGGYIDLTFMRDNSNSAYTIKIPNNDLQTYTTTTLGSYSGLEADGCNDYQVYSSIGIDVANKATNSTNGKVITFALEDGLTASLSGTMEYNKHP